MKTVFEVLSQDEIERIHAASLEVLATVGIRVVYATVRDLFRQAGAHVDEEKQSVRLPEWLVQQAIASTPNQFKLYGSDGRLEMLIGGDAVQFATLGTPPPSVTWTRRPPIQHHGRTHQPHQAD